MQAHDAQIDDIAFQKDRHGQHLQDRHAQLGRDHLQRGRDLVIQHARQGQHIDQMQYRRPEPPSRVPAKGNQQDPRDPDDGGIGDDIVDPRQFAQGTDAESQRDDRNARPAIGQGAGTRRKLFQLTQEHQRGQDRDQRAMAVFGQLPGRQQRVQPVGKEPPRRQCRQRQPEQAGHAGQHCRPVTERGYPLA